MDTGTTRFKHLWGAALCLILLAAAIPLAVLALSMSAQKTETLVSPELETEELTVPDKTAEPVEQEKRIKRKGLILDPPPISPDFVNPPTAGFPMFVFPPAAAQNNGNVPTGENITESEDSAAPEITLVMEGKVYDGVFTFEGNKITYFHRNAWGPLLPQDIMIDGKPWKDLTKPFELDYTPDYAKAVILEKELDEVRAARLYSIDDTKKFSLSIEDATSWEGRKKMLTSPVALVPFRIKLAMKNQLPHTEVIWKRMHSPSSKTAPSGYNATNNPKQQSENR